jgi:hypothetical protein
MPAAWDKPLHFLGKKEQAARSLPPVLEYWVVAF